jgi:hypothetical protein
MKEHDGKEHSGKGSDAHGNFYKGLSLIVYTQQDNTGGADYA